MGYLRGFTHESVWGWVKANMATHAGEAFHKLPGQISTPITIFSNNYVFRYAFVWNFRRVIGLNPRNNLTGMYEKLLLTAVLNLVTTVLFKSNPGKYISSYCPTFTQPTWMAGKTTNQCIIRKDYAKLDNPNTLSPSDILIPQSAWASGVNYKVVPSYTTNNIGIALTCGPMVLWDF